MVRRTWWMAAVLLALGAAPGVAQVKLQFKFPEGKTYRFNSEVHVDQTLTINGMAIDTKSDQMIRNRMAIGQKRPDGSIPVVQTLDAIKTQIELPGGISMSIDSENPDAPQGELPQLKVLRDLIAAMAGASYTVVIGPDGKVTGVEGIDKAVPKIDQLKPEVADLVRKRFDAERLKRESEEEFTLFPDILVRPGEPWERSETMDLGEGQTMTFQRRYEYLGTTEKEGKTLDRISVKALAVGYNKEPDPNSPVQVTKSNLKVDSSEGEILFDREEGRVVQNSAKTHITGDLTLSVGGQELPSQLDLTIETKTAQQPGA